MEGDSALGSVKLSRDAEFQGIMPVRGKILNCLKADYGKIFKSEIITDLMKVLGCGVEVDMKKVKDLNAFDLNNLRWNKIILCSDADVDGFQIRTLILTMIYRLAPTLIQEGYVYIAETPLFEINSKGKTWFAYSEEEGTYAANHFPDSIPEEVKQARLDELMALQEEIALESNASKVGQIFDVIVDREEEDYYVGRTEYDSPEVDPEVLIAKDRFLTVGDFCRVKVVEALPFELMAVPVELD